MRRSNILAGALAAAALAALALPAAAANLVTNGSFETGDFSGWTQTGDTTFTGVTGIANFVAPTDGAYQAMFGEVVSTGTISQDLATVAGGQYTVSFDLTSIGHDFNYQPWNSFAARFGGQVLTSLTDSAAFGYTHFSFNVTATGALTTLAFDTFNEPAAWQMDDVRVDGPAPPDVVGGGLNGGGVPEPDAWALMIVGAGAAGAMLRRKRLGFA